MDCRSDDHQNKPIPMKHRHWNLWSRGWEYFAILYHLFWIGIWSLWQIIIHNDFWIVVMTITKINQFRWNIVILIYVHVLRNILSYSLTYWMVGNILPYSLTYQITRSPRFCYALWRNKRKVMLTISLDPLMFHQ